MSPSPQLSEAVKRLETSLAQRQQHTMFDGATVSVDFAACRAVLDALKEAQEWQDEFNILGETPQRAWAFYKSLESSKIAWECEAEAWQQHAERLAAIIRVAKHAPVEQWPTDSEIDAALAQHDAMKKGQP